VKSLEAALWAFYDAMAFRQTVLGAVNLGDDADTTGAVCGQLGKMFWGESEETAKRLPAHGDLGPELLTRDLRRSGEKQAAGAKLPRHPHKSAAAGQ
jgi:hypothetical protein